MISRNLVVYFNGPPRAGKDEAADAVTEVYGAKAVKLPLARQVKNATHAAYGLYGVPHDHFETVKDQPRPEFFGYTPREAYIDHSERYMKPRHGERIFGLLWLREALKHSEGGPRIFAVSDSGFAQETVPAIEAFGVRNVLLVRLHRQGKTFKGDSRSYIELPDVVSLDLLNDGTCAAEHRRNVGTVVASWVASLPR